jgi:hypothetical protein
MQAGAVSSPKDDETKLRRDETIFRFGEDFLKRALDINSLTKRRAAKAQ